MHIDKSKLPDFLRHDRASLAAAADDLVRGIRDYFSQSGYGKAVIGLSGGIDSGTSFALGVRALGPENVIAVRLPFRSNNDRSLAVAEEIAGEFGLPDGNLLTWDITPAVEASWSALRHHFHPPTAQEERIRLGNHAARERMKVLMDIATHVGGLVLGTENRTEEVMAYFTIGGDSVSNLEPIQGLWKVEVFQLAEYLGLPESVLNRAPSAELWDGQTDEGDLGSYAVADTVLAARDDLKLSREETIQRYGVRAEDFDRVVAYAGRMRGKRHAPGKIARPYFG
jgi:NAD+ synthase